MTSRRAGGPGGEPHVGGPCCAACGSPLHNHPANPTMAWTAPDAVVCAAHMLCLVCFPGLEFLADIKR